MMNGLMLLKILKGEKMMIWDIALTKKRNFLNLMNDVSILKETFIQEQYAWLVENLKPDTVAVDIGANIGDSAIYLAMNPNIKEVWAFEPYPGTFERLRQNIGQSIRKDKIKIFNEAIGEPGADYWINISSDDSDSFKGVLKKGKGKKVHVAGLDKILNHINSSKAIVKMDCEGYEFKILDKGLDLSKVYKMQIEVHSSKYLGDNGYELLKNLKEIDDSKLIDFLDEKGFSVDIKRKADATAFWIYAWKG